MNKRTLTQFLGVALCCLLLLFSACNKRSDEAQPRPEAAAAHSDATAAAAIGANVPSNAEVGRPTTFTGSCRNVYRIIANVDGYIIRDQVVSGQTSWTFAYSFTQSGNRHFHLNAFDQGGNIVASTYFDMTVLPAGGVARALQQLIMRRCAALAPKNRPYVFDGVGDCYGYVRQVWNAVLYDGGEHTEDYGSGYDKSRWIRWGNPYLPVATAPDANWRKVTDWDDMPTGMPISSQQGHAWGADWHGAIYAGKVNGVHMMWDNSGRHTRNGAYNRPVSESAHISNGYYYIPLYRKLKGL